MFKDLFKTKPKYVTVRAPQEPGTRPETVENRREIPDGLWVKCDRCNQIIYHKELSKNLNVCPKCDYHFRMSAKDRLERLMDTDSFQEFDLNIHTVNPLNFPEYENKVKKTQKSTGLNEGVITGKGTIDGEPVVMALIDFSFLGGSMGSVVGEKITRAIERAAEEGLPFICISAGGGGARMHEGILSLMQMAKTCQALNYLAEKKGLYISVLTDPTMGGVYASFASQGDIILAEPGALIGFAGPRVIQQTIRQTLPPGFQTSEFVLEHGMVDAIVHRKDLRSTLAFLLRFHGKHDKGGKAIG
jgi:acetyl-CoA carboxylase carboxyl transferase subunit beta